MNRVGRIKLPRGSKVHSENLCRQVSVHRMVECNEAFAAAHSVASAAAQPSHHLGKDLCRRVHTRQVVSWFAEQMCPQQLRMLIVLIGLFD